MEIFLKSSCRPPLFGPFKNGAIEEHFIGKKDIKKENTYVYPGHVLTKTRGDYDNMYGKKRQSDRDPEINKEDD